MRCSGAPLDPDPHTGRRPARRPARTPGCPTPPPRRRCAAAAVPGPPPRSRSSCCRSAGRPAWDRHGTSHGTRIGCATPSRVSLLAPLAELMELMGGKRGGGTLAIARWSRRPIVPTQNHFWCLGAQVVWCSGAHHSFTQSIILYITR